MASGLVKFSEEANWVSEQILNGTSAQLGYTVPCTLVHPGKYRTEDTDNTQTKYNSEKQITQNTAKQKYSANTVTIHFWII